MELQCVTTSFPKLHHVQGGSHLKHLKFKNNQLLKYMQMHCITLSLRRHLGPTEEKMLSDLIPIVRQKNDNSKKLKQCKSMESWIRQARMLQNPYLQMLQMMWRKNSGVNIRNILIVIQLCKNIKYLNWYSIM